MPAIRKGAVIAFGIVLVIVQIGDTYVPRNAIDRQGHSDGRLDFLYAVRYHRVCRGKDWHAGKTNCAMIINHFRSFWRWQNNSRQVARARTWVAFY